MKIVQGDQRSEGVGSSHRGGISKRVRLLDGEPGTLGNYSVGIAKSPGRYSPRHRHNFEQFRYQIDGIANYGETGQLEPGMLGYFPEGVHYGPQTQEDGEELAVLVVQFGGVSGNGYLGRDDQAAAAAELKAFGEFRNGVFHRNEGVPGKRNMDAFEALWEHVNGRPVTYPAPRYNVPVLIKPDNFSWVPVPGAAGVEHKTMGVFTEGRCTAEFLKLASGARYVGGTGRDIYVVLSGDGEVEGEPFRRFTAVSLDPGERATFKARATSEIIHFRLPDIDTAALSTDDAVAAA